MLKSNTSISALGLFLIVVLLVTITAFPLLQRCYQPMARILILIVLVWILYLIIKRLAINAKAESAKRKTEQNPKNQEEKMLQCTQCGCHVPESETKLINHQIICNNPACSKITHGD